MSAELHEHTTPEGFQDLLGSVYEAATASEKWPAALRLLADRLDSHVAVLASYDFESETGRIEHAFNVDERMVRLYSQRFGAANPWMQHAAHFQLPGLVWKGEQVVPQEELVETDYYKEFLAPQNIFHTLCAVVDKRGSSILHLRLGRPRAAPKFSDADVDLCREALVHMQRATHIQSDFKKHCLIEHAAMEALDCVSIGLAVVDSKGRLLAANALAHALIASGDGLVKNASGLEIRCRGRSKSLHNLIADGAHANGNGAEQAPDFLALQQASGAQLFAALVHPVESGADAAVPNGAHASLVIICDPERKSKLCEQALCRFYDLTPAEARLAARLAGAARLDEAAMALGISIHTARTHLKRIFDKTGTDRQADLIRVLCRGVGQICVDNSPSVMPPNGGGKPPN